MLIGGCCEGHEGRGHCGYLSAPKAVLVVCVALNAGLQVCWNKDSRVRSAARLGLGLRNSGWPQQGNWLLSALQKGQKSV